MGNSPSGLIGATIYAYLHSQDYNFDVDEEKGLFSLGFNLDNDRVNVRILYNEESEWFSVIAFPSHSIPVKQIDKILPALNTLNFNALFGAFYVDPSDGELAFRCTATVDDRSINETIVGVMLSTALNSVDDNINTIMKALYA